MEQIIYTMPTTDFFDKIEKIVETKVSEVLMAKEKKEADTRLYRINQVANKLHLGHSTVKKIIADGRLQKTADNRISQKALNKYIENAK